MSDTAEQFLFDGVEQPFVDYSASIRFVRQDSPCDLTVNLQCKVPSHDYGLLFFEKAVVRMERRLNGARWYGGSGRVTKLYDGGFVWEGVEVE